MNNPGPDNLDVASIDATKPRWLGLSACGVFLVLLTVYHLNGDFLIGNDSKPNVFLAVSLLKEGNLSFTPSEMPFMFIWSVATDRGPMTVHFDSWGERFQGMTYRQISQGGALSVQGPKYYVVPSIRTAANGERIYVNTFGLGSGLMALPVFAVQKLVTGGDLVGHQTVLWYGAKFAAAAMVAASAAMIFLTAGIFTSPRRAALVALAYGLGTCVWSTSSQALWQHGPNEFLLAMGIYFLVRLGQAKGNWKWAGACGLALSAAVACRPTSVVVAAAVAVYLAIVDRKALAAYIAACLPIAVLLGAYNAYYLGSPFEFGQSQAGHDVAVGKTGSPELWQTPLWLGAAGLLVSPSRGLLVYSPFLAFAAGGIVLAWRRRELAFLRPLIISLAALLGIAFKWFDWWGGWCYGYRPIVDAMPIFALLLIPVIGWICRKKAVMAVFAVLLAWSVAVQAVGAFAYDLTGWNNRSLGWEVHLLNQETPVFVETIEEVNRVAATQPTRGYRQKGMDIDMPEYRCRLWSLSDNPLLYYLVNFRQARETKHEQMDSWSSQLSG